MHPMVYYSSAFFFVCICIHRVHRRMGRRRHKPLIVTCRICLEPTARQLMICPCKCRGSIQYVHGKCHDREMEYRHACSACLGYYRAPLDRAQNVRFDLDSLLAHLLSLAITCMVYSLLFLLLSSTRNGSYPLVMGTCFLLLQFWARDIAIRSRAISLLPLQAVLVTCAICTVYVYIWLFHARLVFIDV